MGIFKRNVQPGSRRWLIAAEEPYGVVHGLRRSKASPLDPRPDIMDRPMMSGGRMNQVGYAKVYERILRPYIGKPVTLVECGVLRGTGLLVWSQLFPTGRVIGLDIDFANLLPQVEEMDNVELHTFDQFAPDFGFLRGRRIDIFIDDATHLDPAIVGTMRAALPHMAPGGLYVVEDNATCLDAVKALLPSAYVPRGFPMVVAAS